MILAWHKYGGGKELLDKIYNSLGANVVSFPYGPMPTQPLGWYKKVITKPDDFKGMKFRTVGISIDLVPRHGRSGERAARRRDRAGVGPWSDRGGGVQQRVLRPRPRLPRRLEGLHAAELPPERRAVRDPVQQDQVRRAAGEDEGDHRIRRRRRRPQDMSWKAIDRYSKDYIELQTKDKVRFYRTPDSVLQKQLEIFDQVEAKKSAENPTFKEIAESQRAFAARAVKWDLDTNVSPPHGLQPLFRQACR